MVIFRFFKMAAAATLDLWIFIIFNCRNVEEVHTALSCQISWRSVKLSRRYANISIFPIWRLSTILNLWCACLDHLRRAFGGLYHCAKFGWNRCSSFDDMHVFWFREFGLKMPIHAPKIGVLGNSNETRAPIANPPNGAQLVSSPYHSPGPCSSVDVRPRTDRHTDTRRDTQTRVTTIHFASSATHAKCS